MIQRARKKRPRGRPRRRQSSSRRTGAAQRAGCPCRFAPEVGAGGMSGGTSLSSRELAMSIRPPTAGPPLRAPRRPQQRPRGPVGSLRWAGCRWDPRRRRSPRFWEVCALARRKAMPQPLKMLASWNNPRPSSSHHVTVQEQIVVRMKADMTLLWL